MGRSQKGVAPIKEWNVVVHPVAQQQLSAITDRRVREDIEQSIDDLRYDPDIKGKPLRKTLKNTRSIRAGSQRYRIIYNIKEHIGHRYRY